MIGQQGGLCPEEVRVELMGTIGVDRDQVAIAIEGFGPILPLELRIGDVHGRIIGQASGGAIEQHFFKNPFAVVLRVVPRPRFVGPIDVVEFVRELKPIVPDLHAPLVDAILVTRARVLLDQLDVVIFRFGIILSKEIRFGGHVVSILFQGTTGPVFSSFDVARSGFPQ